MPSYDFDISDMESVQFNFKLINKKKLKTASGEKRRGNLLSELS